ncbi:MAG: hypothetical protein ACYC8T_08855 [Myxococcaceae bacterium]
MSAWRASASGSRRAERSYSPVRMADDEVQGWRRHLSAPRAGRTALICAAVLSLPFCFAGIFGDDYFHQLILDQQTEVPVSRWELFTFAWGDPARIQPLVERGPYPWWTLPKVQFAFVRPLSVALANLEHLAFGRAFFWHHLHSVGWYLALVAAVTAFFRRSLGAASPIAALAAVLFAISGSHGLAAGWIANRNAMVATVPALLGVLAHVRWREKGDRWGLPLSLVLYAIGLSGGEAALGALAYLGAYELSAAPRRWRSRLLALLPVALLGAGYVALYRALGAGAFGSEMYLDPIRQPLPFLLHAPERALALVAAQFLGASADLWLAVQAARPVLVVLGVVAVVLMAVLVRRLWPRLDEKEQRGLRWLALGAALSMVPVLATFPLNRLLVMPSVGGSALIAVVLWHGWSAANGRLVRYGARLLFFTTVIIGLAGWPAVWAALRLGGDEQTRSALETNLTDEALAGRVLVFAAPDPGAAIYLHRVRIWNHKPKAKSWVTLSFAPYAHRLTRTARDTVELEVVDGRMLETVFEQLVRSSKFPVPEGLRVRLDGAEVTVVGFDQGLPNRLRVHFDEDPEGGSYTLATFEGGKLSPLSLPAVGQTLEIPRLRSLLSL